MLVALIFGVAPNYFESVQAPPAHAAIDFKTQIVEVTINAGSTSATAEAPISFDAVVPSSTIALISGVVQHAGGYVSTTNQIPSEISAAVVLTDTDTITVTRSSTVNSTIVKILLIEYTGNAGGINEFIVRDRRLASLANGVATNVYAPGGVVNANDVVIFTAGSVDAGTNASGFNRSMVRGTYSAPNVTLTRGNTTGAVQVVAQTVEFTGSNWTIQTGTNTLTTANSVAVPIANVANTSRAWIYYTLQAASGTIADINFQTYFPGTTNQTTFTLDANDSATASRSVQWYIIENPSLNVIHSTAAATSLSADLVYEITASSAINATSRSFAWVTNITNITTGTHPRDMWQYSLTGPSTISLERNRSGATTDFRYQVVELPLGPNPDVTQTHYHWRNDNGSETTATSATSGVQDTILSNAAEGTTYRLRIGLSNEGNVSSTAQYRLEYGVKGSTCSQITTWTDVGASSDDWDMSPSTNITDGANTTNIATGSGGVTDENTTFVTSNGAVKDTSSQTGSITLTNTEHVDLEYSIVANGAAVDGATYCFRVTNAGTAIETYDVYPQIVLQSFDDFKIQRGTTTISGATSATITAGIDYVAPASASRAFIRITNSQHTGAGSISSGNQNADDVTAYISNPTNILTSVNFVRVGAANDTRVDWEIIEYAGPSGGPNEIVVRGAGFTTFVGAATTVNSATVSGVVTDNDIVPFITGQANADTGRTAYYAGAATTLWNSGSDLIGFTRGTGGVNANISWAAVEFVGSNWNVQRVQHTYVASAGFETENLGTAVSSTARTFLHTQKRMTSAANSVSDFGHQVFLSSTTQVSFSIDSTASSPASHISVAYVIENTQTDGTPMVVTRSNGVVASGANEPETFNINIGATLPRTNIASLFFTNTASSATTTFPRPIMGAILNSTTQYTVWSSDTGASRTYRAEVVQWPTAPTLLQQANYRWFTNTDSTTAGAPLALENTPYVWPTNGDAFRLRMLLHNIGGRTGPNEDDYKLQFAVRVGTCDTSFTGETYNDITTSTILAYNDNPTPVDGALLTGNPGNPTSSYSISNQEYVELNNFSNSSEILGGTDGLWDFSLIDNGLYTEEVYCVRAVYADGSPLFSYSQIPQFTAGPGVLTVDIIDNLNASVVSPSVTMSPLTFSFNDQVSTGTLGVSTQKIKITNTTITENWTLSLAATSGPTSLFTGTGGQYDFNDITASVADGGDGDAVGGLLTVDPSSSTLTPLGGCTNNDISLGSLANYNEGVTNSITLLSAGLAADIICHWELTGVDLSADIPGEQSAANDYSLNMTLSVLAI